MRRLTTGAAIVAAAACAGLSSCGTSDEDEVRAVAQEFRRALDADDGVRACRLLTPAARERLPDCPDNVRSVDPGGTLEGAAQVRGDRATIGTGDRAEPARTLALERIDGAWRIDAREPSVAIAAPSAVDRAAAYLCCWRAAGAKIATSAQQLAFAAADAPVVAVRADRVSAKGGDWRIFYTLPADGRDPGIREVIADPSLADVVAYVVPARARTDVVRRARACTAAG